MYWLAFGKPVSIIGRVETRLQFDRFVSLPSSFPSSARLHSTLSFINGMLFHYNPFAFDCRPIALDFHHTTRITNVVYRFCTGQPIGYPLPFPLFSSFSINTSSSLLIIFHFGQSTRPCFLKSFIYSMCKLCNSM